MTRIIFVALSFLTLAGTAHAQQAAPAKPTAGFHCTSSEASPPLEFEFFIFSPDGILSSGGIDRVEFQNLKIDGVTISRVSSHKAEMVSVPSPPGFVGYFLLSAAAKDISSDTHLDFGSAIKIREPIDGGRIVRDEDFRAAASLQISRLLEKHTIEYDCAKIKGTTFK